MRNFYEHLFYRTPSEDCFCISMKIFFKKIQQNKQLWDQNLFRIYIQKILQLKMQSDLFHKNVHNSRKNIFGKACSSWITHCKPFFKSKGLSSLRKGTRSKELLLCKLCQNTGFLWPIFSWIRTESVIH